MIFNKPIALINIPVQFLFGPKAAARFLGCHENTLKKLTYDGEIKAKVMGNRKVYTFDELNRFLESLPDYNPLGEDPEEEGEIHG